MAKAAIFDMDGVVLDSEPLYYETYRSILSKAGVHRTPQELGIKIGGTLDGERNYLKHKFPAMADWDKVYTKYTQAINDCASKAPLFGGAMQLVTAVSNVVPLALCSNSPRSAVDAALSSNNLSSSFRVTVSRDDVNKGKPDPEPYAKACRLLKTHPKDCVALEDSAPGIASAKAAGCKTILVNSNHYSKLEVEQIGADLAVETLKQINKKTILEI